MTLHEGIFPSQHPLVKKFFGLEIADAPEECFGQFIYLNHDDPKVIASRFVYLDSESLNINYVSRLNLLLKYGKDYNACLIISSCIYDQHYAKIRKILTTKNRSLHESFEHILNPTNGYMLYSNQFEHAAKIVLNIQPETAIALRKAFNRKQSLNQFCGVSETKLMHFQQLLSHWLLFDTVLTANYSGANHLLLYARSLE